MKFTRRKFLQSSTILLAHNWPNWVLAKSDSTEINYTLTAQSAPVQLMSTGNATAMTYNGTVPAPVIKAKQGKRIRIKLINQLTSQATTIHWHGLRITNNMDGVPYLNQPPVLPGQSFIYDFIPQDAGTFWYHPHLNSLQQMAKGMVGMLIVEEQIPVDFTADIPLSLKKWRLNKDGEFKAQQFIPRKAARHGTKGNWQTVNGMPQPEIKIPAGGAIRLRFANVDNSMLYHIHVDFANTQVLAYDGMPLSPARNQSDYQLGAGMRIDLGLIAPLKPGVEIPIYDKTAMGEQKLLTLITEQTKLPPTKQLPTLSLNPVRTPNLKSAETIKFTFDWDAAFSPNPNDKESKPIFWSINQRSLTEMTESNLGQPLAKLKLGKSYIFILKNTSQYHHPIHLHGFSFTILDSDKRQINPYIADTVMLGKNETIRIAFVADNPGKWMFHCHVIDHMATGLMGYIEVI